MHLVLFDVDGTLVLTGGAGRRALQAAFEAITGDRAHCPTFDFGGMTDRRIVREGLRSAGLQDDPRTADALLEAYLEHLADEVARSPTYRVLPGVVAALERLSARADVRLGLGTGNVKRGASTKLARGGLEQFFRFGGFGCDHEDRAEILRAAVARGCADIGRSAAEVSVVVVGDTPRDVEAARAIGAAVVAVATGGTSHDELAASGPDVLLGSLVDPGWEAAVLAPSPAALRTHGGVL